MIFSEGITMRIEIKKSEAVSMNEQYDVIIIGGGPGGLTAAIYAGRAGRKTLLIEKGSYGGRVNTTAEIRNYPGTVRESGEGLMQRFREHAESFPTVSMKRTTVTGVEKEGDIFTVHTRRRGDFQAACVILDLGTRPRVLGIPGEEEFAGHGVAYCATCDGEFFKDKEIYVLGAGDQAIEEADYLTRLVKKVTVIVLHEKGHLDCNKLAAQKAYENPKIDFVWNATLAEIRGRDWVESLMLKNVVTGEMREVKTEGLFSFVGMVPQTDFVKELVHCDSSGYIPVTDKMETCIPGLYAVGDCTRKFLRQIVTSAADGAVAAEASGRYTSELEQIRGILSPDSGKTVFVFYNPYHSEEIEKVTKLERMLGESQKVYRQDITRQSLLYQELGLKETVAAAYYENGQLIKTESFQLSK